MGGEKRNGLGRFVRRVREGLERRARSVPPPKRDADRDAPRMRPYLEPLEPRILLSADVGLVPDSVLAPPLEDFDPRLLLEPEVHDEVLVREPSRLAELVAPPFDGEAIAPNGDGKVSQTKSDPASATAATKKAAEDSSASEADEEGDDAAESILQDAGASVDPSAAARALQAQLWQAEQVDASQAVGRTSQVVVIDAEVPEAISLLEALLDGTSSAQDGSAGAELSSPHSGSDRDEPLATAQPADARLVSPIEAAETADEASVEGAKAGGDRASRLVESLEARGIAVVVLDAERDGLDQLLEIARAYQGIGAQGIGAMHVVSHGGRGALRLGQTRVTTETLRARGGQLADLGDALGAEGDLLLYGCEVGAGEVGIEFVSTFAELAGVGLAASDDLTGAAGQGGDWDLEVAIGAIETPSLGATDYTALLRTLEVASPPVAPAGVDVTLRFDPAAGTAGAWVLTPIDTYVDGEAPAPAPFVNGFELVAGAPGDDVVIIRGTEGDDTLRIVNVDAGVNAPELIRFEGLGGDDTLEIVSASPEDFAGFTGILELDGGAGIDTLVVRTDGGPVDPEADFAADFAGTIRLIGGTEADSLSVDLAGALRFAGSIELEGGEGEDDLSVALAAATFADDGSVSLDGGEAADFLSHSGFAASTLATSTLIGGAGDDDYSLAPGIEHIGLATIVEGAGDGADDTLFFPAGFERFTSGSLERENVENEVIALGDLSSLVDGLSAFARWADRLDEEGDLGAALAGLFGNVDVGVGTAMDLGEVFDQLAIAIQVAVDGAGPGGLQAETLRQFLNDFEREGIEHRDRTLYGDSIIGTGFDDPTSGFGLTLRLDDGEVFSLGLAATSGPPSDLTFGVRLTRQDAASFPTITFERETNGEATIRRASGDWTADGFRAGQTIRFEDSLKAGVADTTVTTFEIDSISGDGRLLTLVESDDGEAFDAFLVASPGAADVPDSRTIDPSGSEPRVTVAKTLFRASSSAAGELDWKQAGFREGQTITASFATLADAEWTVDGLSEDGLVLTVEEDVDFAIAEPSQVTGRAIVAGAGAAGSPPAGSLRALVSALNAAIDESDLSGRVRAVATGLDEAGETDTTRLGFQVLDSEVDELALVWTDGPQADLGFAAAGTEYLRSDLSGELKGLGELDVGIGASYRVATFVTETSNLTPITVANVSAAPGTEEVFAGSGDGRLLFESRSDGLGTLTRQTGSWTDSFSVGDVVTILHEPANAGAAPRPNDGSFEIVALDDEVLTLERALVVVESTTSPGEGTITRSRGSWTEEGFSVGQTVDLAIDASTTRRFTVAGVSNDVLQIEGSDFSGLGAPVTPESLRVTNAVRLEFDPASGRLSLEFDYRADRASQFNVGLGDAADEKGLSLDASTSVDLDSAMRSRLRIDLTLGDTDSFEIDVQSLDLSARVNVPGAGEDAERNIAAGTTANVGFLGAQVAEEGASLTLDAGLALPAPIDPPPTPDPLEDWRDLTIADLEGESDTRLADRALDLTRTAERFDLFMPLDVSPGLAIAGTSFNEDGTPRDPDEFSAPGLGIFTEASASYVENPFDGREALVDEPPDGSTTPFSEFEDVEAFAEIDAQGFIQLLGQIRTGIQQVGQSELIRGLDVPFVQGAIDSVVNLADAFGDALLYDDGDDGIDRDDEGFLVTDLNRALDDAGLGDLIEARVVDLAEDGSTKTFEFFAIDDSVTGIAIAPVAPATDLDFFGFDVAAASSDPDDPTLKGQAAVTLENGQLLAGQTATITVTRTRGNDLRTETVSVLPGATEDNKGLGNDVAKLLDANNTATFDTAQELKAKLVELALEAIGVEGLAYDSTTNILTYELDLSHDLFEEELSVDFDLDLGPVAGVETVGDPTLTIGGSVGFGIKFGIDLSDDPNGQSGISDTTALTDLRGIDEISDLIKTNPSITARNTQEVTEIDAEEESIEIELDRVRMLNVPELTFRAAAPVDVSADTLVNNLVYLAVEDGYEIQIDGSASGFQQAALAVDPTVPDPDDPRVYVSPELSFEIRIVEAANNTLVDEFTVVLAAQTYDVSSRNVFKSRWLADIERAIEQAQQDGTPSTIERAAGSGSFVVEGFLRGQVIQLIGSDSNDGFYEIESVSDRLLTLVEDLDVSGIEQGVQIEGPGIIHASGFEVGQAPFTGVEPGELIQITGSIRNDGVHLVESKPDDATLILATPLDPEPSSNEISLFDSNASLRLDAGAVTPGERNAVFTLELGGERYEVSVFAEADEDDPFAPNTSDNLTLTDLVQDFRTALTRARDVNAAADADPVDLSGRVEVGLDGMRLVLTLATGELAEDTALSFDAAAGTITRTGADDGDPAGSWAEDGFVTGQLIRVSDSGDNDGLYRILGPGAEDAEDETVIRVERVDATTAIADADQEEGITVVGVIPTLDRAETVAIEAGGVVRRTGSGSFEAEGFEPGQLVVIERAGEYDGTYSIVALSETTLTLADAETGADPSFPLPSPALSGIQLSGSFRMTGISEGARSLGFGSDTGGPQDANLHDFVVFTSDGAGEFFVTLDGAETVGEVLRRIEEAAGGSTADGLGRIRARIAPDGTGIELVERGQLSGTPRLTFVAADSQILRSEGSWSDDGFAVGETIEITGTARNDHSFRVTAIELDGDDNATILVVEAVDAANPVEDEAFVRDATIVDPDFSQTDDDDFRVELINNSLAAIGLGILRDDAALDANQDGRVDLQDRDGLIEGGAIGGASIFDRIFIEDPELRANLFLRPTDDDPNDGQEGIDVTGRFGFIEATLNADGALFAEASITLNEPGDDPDGKITLREIATGLGDIFDFIDVPRFSGNSLDDSAGVITFRNVAGHGEIRRTNGDWRADDEFETGQKITIRNAGALNGDYLIIDLKNDGGSATGALDVLVLEETFEGTSVPTTIDAGADVESPLEIAGAIGTLTLSVEEFDVGFADFAALGGDAAVVVTLFDFGDPFYRETVGPETDKGGTVSFDAVDQIRVVPPTGDLGDPGDDDSVRRILDELREDVANLESVKARITYTDSEGEERTASAEVLSIDEDGRIRVDEDFVDDIDGLTIQKVRFTKPPRTEIDTPDLGNLLDFQDLSFLDIVRGLQLASDFLSQYEAFQFLNDPIPIIDVSFNDLLAYAEDLGLAVEEFQRDPAGSLQSLEARLEAVLGIDDGTDVAAGQDPFDIELSYASEELAGASTGETQGILRIDLILGSSFDESLNVEFDLGEGLLAGAAGLRAGGAAEIRIAFGVDISETQMRGDPRLVFRQNPDSEDDEIERLDGERWRDDGFLPGQTIKVKGTIGNDGRYEIADIVNDGRTLVLKDELAASEGVDAGGGADPGIAGVELVGARAISLFEDTAISARFDAGADDVSFRGAVGPIGLFIDEGRVGIGGAIEDPANPGDPADIFRAGLDLRGPLGDGTTPIFATGEYVSDPVTGETRGYTRQVLGEVLDNLADSFDLRVEGGLDVLLPVYFPTQSLLQGSIGLDFDLSLSLSDGLNISEVAPVFLDENGVDVGFGGLFDLSALLDLGQLSLFDNVLLAIDGFDLFLGGLQDVLDGEIFGLPLPLIGDSLADGARFIEDLRQDFVEPFRDLVEDTESFVDDQEDPDKNIVSQILFDLLERTGLLLVTHAADGSELAEDQVFTARRENLVVDPETPLEEGQFYLRQVIMLEGTRRNVNREEGEDEYLGRADARDAADEIDLDLPSALIEEKAFLEWDFRLGQDLGFVDTDIALDFGIPAIGLEADGAIGLELGWDLELGFGLDFQDGFYFDIGSADELEVTVDVVLPDSLTGRLAFLQLDAINAGSGLGATFAIDVVEQGADAGEDADKLAFTELGKLRLEAGLAAEARALLDLQLQLNEELLADFANVFPTVVAEFELDWGLGQRGGLALEFDAEVEVVTVDGVAKDGGVIRRIDRDAAGLTDAERARLSFRTDSYMIGQIIRISGTENAANDGGYTILEVHDDRLVVDLAGRSFQAQSAQQDVTILLDIRSLSGSVLSDGLQRVEFREIGLDLGSFISDFAKPVLGEIQKVTRPIQPIVEILTSPIPVISDLGPDVTLLDLARATGKLNPALIEAVADIISLVNAIPTDVSTIVIPFGHFTIFDRADENMMLVDPTDPDADLTGMNEDATSGDSRSLSQKLDEQNAQDSRRGKSTSFVSKLANTRGFEFPILTDPSQIFGLLTGQEVVLFGYDMPPLEFDFSFSASYPVYGPLAVGIFGSAAGKIDFAFGFDSSGLQRFFETDFRNPLLIFDGFFVSDNPESVTGDGPDGNELEFDLEFGLSAGLELGIARAGVAGGLGAEIDFDLFDPNRDGKIRVGEILENIENEFLFGNPIISPIAIFDVSGELTARAFAFLEINLLLFSVDIEFDITPRITLVEFDLDFTRAPKLATELDDGTLQLNMGEFSELRLNDDLTDGDEHFVVTSESGGLRVTWVGSNGSDVDPSRRAFTQLYRGHFTQILAKAGEGDDTIDVSGVNQAGIRFEIDGGAGDDLIDAGARVADATSLLRGGEGEDRIVGSDGNDLIFGGAARDTILARGGDDIVFGDDGRLVETEARLRNTPLRVTAQVGTGSSATAASIDRSDGGSFLDDGFVMGQVLEISETPAPTDENPAPEPSSEGVYQVASVTRDRITLVGTGVFAPTAGGPIPDTGSRTSDRFEVLAVDSEYTSAYQAIGGSTDGDDAIAGGLGNDWIFGSGGADLIIGGAFGGLGSVLDLSALRAVQLDADGGSMIEQAGDPDDDDILIGDGGKIRVDREGQRRNLSDDENGVEDTARGLVFASDRLYGSGGDDELYGGRGDDELRGGAGADRIFGEAGFDTLFGDAGNDAIFGGRDGDVIDGGANDDTIEGEQGADLIRGGSGDDLILGQAGADTIYGEEGADTIRGGSDPDVIFGGLGRDDLGGQAGDDFVFGDVSRDAEDDAASSGFGAVATILPASLLAQLIDDAAAFEGRLDVDSVGGDGGVDRILVRGGSDFVDGQADGDQYRIDNKGAENSARITVFDSGVSTLVTDRLIINGTARADQFLIRAATDPEGLAFVASINRGSDVERIDYDRVEDLVVNGLFGDDAFAVDDLRASATLNGDAGDDFFQIGQLYRSRRTIADANIAPEDQFTTTETTRGFLSNGVSKATTINGGNDNDEIIVFRNVAVLQVNGQAGDDSVTVRAFALVNPEDKIQDETLISGGAGADTIRYAVNAPVNIDGGDGLDSVAVIGTEFADEFVITKDGVFGAGLNVRFVNIEFLKVDGAEGDDIFYVQSTNEAILTEVVGGLGSDTFQVAEGAQRAVTSNDLLGHSGLILHDVESNDPVYQGPEGFGIAANGISANVGDADEPGIVISERNGFTRLAEGGALDWYTIVLTRRPDEDVVVRAIAPNPTNEEEQRGEASFGVFNTASGSNSEDGRSTALVFTADDWWIPQTVYVHATSDEAAQEQVGGEAVFPGAGFDFDDDALEGERFGVIRHEVVSGTLAGVNDTRTGLVDVLGDFSRDEDGQFVTEITLQELIEDQDFSYELTGRSFEIISAPDGTDSGGLGQSLLIKSSETVGGVTRLTLYGVFDPEDLPLTGSEYRIVFYDALQLPNVTVQIDDDDAADVLLTEIEDLRVFERSEDQAGGIEPIAVYEVELSRRPRNGETLFVDLDVTSAFDEPDQLLLSTLDPRTAGGPVGAGTLRLEFSADEDDPNAWSVPQLVYVQAIDDRPDASPADTTDLDPDDEVFSPREGFHRGLIEHRVTSLGGGDVDEIVRVEDEQVALGIDPGSSTIELDSVLLANAPIQYRGDVAEATATTLSGFPGGAFSLADLDAAIAEPDESRLVVRITKGPGADQQRQVVSIDGNTLTVDRAWDTAPDENSRFSVAGVEIRIDGASEPLDAGRFVVNGSTVVFLDELGAVETRELSSVSASYGYLDRGYEGRVEERLSIQVVDNDTPGVLVLESDFRTDVIEVNPDDPRAETPFDTYQIVLSRPPGQIDPISQEPPGDFSTEEAYVDVIVEPGATPTSRGDLVRGERSESGGTLVGGEVQVEVRAGADATGARIDLQGRLVLRFTAENWNVPQTVEVVARTDQLVDGTDTKVFAPRASTLVDIQGPLLIDGAGGTGSLEGLTPPVLLPNQDPELAETNVKTPTGDVLDATQDSLTVDTASLDTYVSERNLAGREDLLGRTVEIVRGAGIDRFREIVGVTDLGGGETRIDIAPAWYDSEEPGDAFDLADVSAYKITRQSLNFFVDESESRDLLFVHDEDSPADSRGRMIALDYDLFPEMVSFFNEDDVAPGSEEFVTPNRLVGFNMGPDTEIARALRPGGITYSSLEGFELDLGYGNNDLEIESVHARDDEVRTFTRIRTGRGNDAVRIALDEPAPGIGLPWVEVDAGRGDDTIDASASTLGLQLVGGDGADTLTGGDGADLVFGDFGSLDFLVIDRAPVFQPIVETLQTGDGGDDVLAGLGGNDRLFGGAGNDTVLGGDGEDVLFGDYGKISLLPQAAALIETTQTFQGGLDFIVGGGGNDFLFGGAGGDVLGGRFDQDVIIGEYARITTRNGIVSSVVRFGQGDLDLAASSLFGLYDPRFGPFARNPAPGAPPVGRVLPDSAPVAGTDPTPLRRLNAGARGLPPGVHEVSPGDSLWNLAEREFGDGFRWPEIYALNRGRVTDPDLILPGQEIELPRGALAERLEAEREADDRVAVAELDRALEALDARDAAESRAGWRFFDPLAVGAGPADVEAVPIEVERPETEGRAPLDVEEPEHPEDEGAQRIDEDAAQLELGGVIWSSLVGWRATASGSQARSRDRWLRFDERVGRFG